MGPSWAGWLIAALAAACAAGLGLALARARRLHRAASQDRNLLLDRERENAARAAVDAERARIATELHDIVSHNVSLMVVQVSAAREVLAAAITGSSIPPDAARALRAVEDTGRGAMTELRHLLGLLALSPRGEDEQDLSPQPSLSRLSPLIDKIAFAGLPVDVKISGQPRPLPAGIDLTAYRIVQEALTNALKHGNQAKAEVTIRYADRSLRVEVLNSGPSVLTDTAAAAGGPDAGAGQPNGTGTGRGLLGLAERVALYGGDLDARRRLGGGYRVRARIPLDPP
ncbi:MAG: sensor histidine kinase [Streptosporangiaceae bacterium]